MILTIHLRMHPRNPSKIQSQSRRLSFLLHSTLFHAVESTGRKSRLQSALLSVDSFTTSAHGTNLFRSHKNLPRYLRGLSEALLQAPPLLRPAPMLFGNLP